MAMKPKIVAATGTGASVVVGASRAAATASATGAGSSDAVGAAKIEGPALEALAKGFKFPSGETSAATEQHKANSAERHRDVIEDLKLVLLMYKDEPQKIRFSDGRINASALARVFVNHPKLRSPFSERAVQEAIKKAVRNEKIT